MTGAAVTPRCFVLRFLEATVKSEVHSLRPEVVCHEREAGAGSASRRTVVRDERRIQVPVDLVTGTSHSTPVEEGVSKCGPQMGRDVVSERSSKLRHDCEVILRVRPHIC